MEKEVVEEVVAHFLISGFDDLALVQEDDFSCPPP